MADPTIPSSPQKFSFDNRDLFGRLVRFHGSNPRRTASHVFPKRRGGRVEDQGDGQRTLDVELWFVGPRCAADYADFLEGVRRKPTGLLVHPVHGRWQAFCQGPSEDVVFAQGVNSIQVRVSFLETELDAENPRDVPDTGSQAQNTTAQSKKTQQALAIFMGELALAATVAPAAVGAIQDAVASSESSETPIEDMSAAITSSVGVSSSVVTKTALVAEQGLALAAEVQTYVDSSGDTFDGTEVQAGSSDATETLLGSCQALALTLEETLISVATSPAGAAEAFTEVELLVSECLLLAEALDAERPPLILVTVTETIDVITFAQRRYKKNPSARASQILGLNSIPNPAAIRPGTKLWVPSI